MKKRKTGLVIGSIARALLGLTFVFSGYVKAIDPLGTTYKIEDYLKAFGGFFNNFLGMAEVAAWALIAFEFLLGICLLLNIKTNFTSWLTLIFMVGMTLLTLYIAIKNPVSDCGCFGDALVLSNWATFFKNIVLLALVVAVLLTKKHTPSFLMPILELTCFFIALAFIFIFMTYERLHLPYRDFRPYKIGNNIPELMEIPEDAAQDVYEVAFIYEKDGKQQTFTLQNYPKGDSTWVFVDQVTTLVSKGYEPPIHDFEIVTLDGEDITENVLAMHKEVLIIMYDLSKADTKQMDKVMAILRDAQKNYYYCRILTSSTYEQIEEFVKRNLPEMLEEDYNWEEIFCQTDGTTLKTIVRANPGVIVLKDGTIVDKYNLRNRKIEQITDNN